MKDISMDHIINIEQESYNFGLIYKAKLKIKNKNANKWLIIHYILTTKNTFIKAHTFHSLESSNQIPLTPILEIPILVNWFTAQRQIRSNKLSVDF